MGTGGMKEKMWTKNLSQAKKAVEKTKDWLQEAFKKESDLLQRFKDRPKISFETLPIASVNADEMIAVEFLTDMREVDKKGRHYAFADATLLVDWNCWDRDEKDEVEVKSGTKISMNLARHGALYAAAQNSQKEHGLKGNQYVIANLGKRSYYSKNLERKVSAYDYRFVLADEVKEMLEEAGK